MSRRLSITNRDLSSRPITRNNAKRMLDRINKELKVLISHSRVPKDRHPYFHDGIQANAEHILDALVLAISDLYEMEHTP